MKIQRMIAAALIILGVIGFIKGAWSSLELFVTFSEQLEDATLPLADLGTAFFSPVLILVGMYIHTYQSTLNM